MRAAWFLGPTIYDPVAMTLEPDWPGGVGTSTFQVTAYDIRRLLSGVAPADHVHHVVGTLARANFELAAFGNAHFHYEQYYASAWRQFAYNLGVNPTHTHPILQGGVGNVRFLPEFYMLFVSGEDAQIAALDAAAQWVIAGESIVTLDAVNNVWLFGVMDDTAWAAGEVTAWENRLRVALGIELPSQITNGARFVAWFGPFAAQGNVLDWWDESKYRPTSRPV